jgi:protein-S-isoprenylcysteine O-methyltransferase Ste14
MFTSAWILATARIWLVIAVVFADCLLVCFTRGPWNYCWLFSVGCWAVLQIYWTFAARNTKPASVSKLRGFAFAAGFLLYSLPLSSIPILGLRFIPHFAVVEVLGAFLCASGVGVAIWSRRVLDKSWSPVVAIPDCHTLVQGGPYAIVRHPIYLGFMAAAVGMILALGEIRALVLLNDMGIFLRRLTPEEEILRARYPTEYPEYERRVKKLLPCVW